MKYLVLAILVAIASAGAVSPQSLTILCEDAPPNQFPGPDGKPAGFTVDIVREIQRRVGNKDEIKMVPWARGYEMILSRPGVVLFSMARTAERDSLFNWVGPVLEAVNCFYAKADSGITLASLDDAKRIARIGVYLNDVRDQILTKAGFKNLVRSNDNTLNVKLLMAGRIDMYADSSSAYADNAKAAGFGPSALKMIFAFQKIQVYVAMSKAMPGVVVGAWNAALEEMRKDGSFERILKEYFPGGALPGPAVTKF